MLYGKSNIGLQIPQGQENILDKLYGIMQIATGTGGRLPSLAPQGPIRGQSETSQPGLLKQILDYIGSPQGNVLLGGLAQSFSVPGSWQNTTGGIFKGMGQAEIINQQQQEQQKLLKQLLEMFSKNLNPQLGLSDSQAAALGPELVMELNKQQQSTTQQGVETIMTLMNISDAMKTGDVKRAESVANTTGIYAQAAKDFQEVKGSDNAAKNWIYIGVTGDGKVKFKNSVTGKEMIGEYSEDLKAREISTRAASGESMANYIKQTDQIENMARRAAFLELLPFVEKTSGSTPEDVLKALSGDSSIDTDDQTAWLFSKLDSTYRSYYIEAYDFYTTGLIKGVPLSKLTLQRKGAIPEPPPVLVPPLPKSEESSKPTIGIKGSNRPKFNYTKPNLRVFGD